jgi:NAD(P)-dependent dehydrogenase (short-subunit alcohol dehydrogenase family)
MAYFQSDWRSVMNEDEFSGKTAVVTGAAGGIGGAAARMLAAHGARVLCWDRVEAGLARTAAEIGAETPDATVHVAAIDVTDEAAVTAALNDVPRVDVLFNVAGITVSKPMIDCDVAEMVELMRVNVGSVMTTTRAIVPKMTSGGVIVNTTSSVAQRIGPGQGPYGASKAAVDFITKAFAVELSDVGIRVCAVGPGAVDTPFPLAALQGHPDPGAELLAAAKAWQLIGRLARPEEVAAAMCYLASNAGSFYTGTTLWIDGGSSVK